MRVRLSSKQIKCDKIRILKDANNKCKLRFKLNYSSYYGENYERSNKVC